MFEIICDLCSYTIENGENSEFWIHILEKLLDPVKRAYLSAIPYIDDEDLPRYYLFVGSVVLYKDKEYVVCEINPKSISLIKNTENSKMKQVSLMDKHLSIPQDFFKRNFLSWIDSLSIGEIVDVAVKEHGTTKWKRGVIVDRKQSTYLEALVININSMASSYQNYDHSDMFSVTIRQFSPLVINRAFLRSCNDSTPLVKPLRYNYTHNLLFFQPNIAESAHNGCYIEFDCEAILSPLFVDVLNQVTWHNIWFSLSTLFDLVYCLDAFPFRITV